MNSRIGENNPNFKYKILRKILIKKYITEGKSIDVIAKELNCSIGPIRRGFKIFNIIARKMSDACKIGKTGKYIRTDKHKQIQRLGTIKRFKDIKEIAKYKEKFSGNKNPNWHGGIYHENYGVGFGRYLKEEIRDRDVCVCVNCSLTQYNNGRKLDVHHIDYNKNNHKQNNLVSLCRKCHMKTSYNRTFWENKFKKYILSLERGD